MNRLISPITLMVILLSACTPAGSDLYKRTKTMERDYTSVTQVRFNETGEAVIPSLVPDVPIKKTQNESESEQTLQETAADEQESASLPYPIVDTGQSECFNATSGQACPAEGDAFYGQDAQYSGNKAAYVDNGDGTISDLVTGLMWQSDPGSKMTYGQAVAGADEFSLAGYDDWRLPTIKELYSLILFDGTDVSVCPGGYCQAIPFIDDRYFDFSYGDLSAGERSIDSQFASATKYVSTTMYGMNTDFGVNFADGRIKGYGLGPNDSGKTFFVLYVRGNPDYGINDFTDNSDGTISDLATGLTWMQADSGSGMDWQSALDYCETSTASGYDDWRLPDAKELQSIVDYSRSPLTSNSAAIDPLFSISSITNEAGQLDYPYFWSSTTHADSAGHGNTAAYVAFGTAPGYWQNQWTDVHGAGAQRSDPKTGSASDYPSGHGPQGDAIRVDNYVRCVRGRDTSLQAEGSESLERPARSVESNGNEMQINNNQVTPQASGSGQPPQQAIDACISASEGDACSFNTPNGIVNGSCIAREQLICAPGGGTQPPAQPQQ